MFRTASGQTVANEDVRKTECSIEVGLTTRPPDPGSSSAPVRRVPLGLDVTALRSLVVLRARSAQLRKIRAGISPTPRFRPLDHVRRSTTDPPRSLFGGHPTRFHTEQFWSASFKEPQPLSAGGWQWRQIFCLWKRLSSKELENQARTQRRREQQRWDLGLF